ncbi:MAG: carboxypeptidase-like regulatory domain-containing protein [Vicinamibacterales bacterium]
MDVRWLPGFLMVTLTLTGCDGTRPASPVGPSGEPPIVSPARPSISGSVYDTAFRPLPDTTIEAIEGPGAGASMTTSTGQFVLFGVFDATTRFRASHPGYRSETITPRGDGTRLSLYFVLESDAPQLDAAGRFLLQMSADPTCVGLPDVATSHTLPVVVTRDASKRWQYFVDAPSVTLLHGYAWEGWAIGVAGDVMSIGGGNLHGDPGLIEQVGPDAYLGFDGWAEGTGSVTGGPLLDTAFQGHIEYCGLPADSPVPIVDGRYQCPAQARVRCYSTSHHLTLTRQ